MQAGKKGKARGFEPGGDNTNWTDDKLTELNSKMEQKYTMEEVNGFINVGKQLASKAVLSCLMALVKERVSDEVECARVIKKIRAKMPYNYAGYVQCSFHEITLRLNVSLSLVNKDYKTEIDIPHVDYAKDLYEKYDFLKGTALAYWAQFCEENPPLIARLAKYFPNPLALTVDETNPTTMYFETSAAKRVGIFCYYVDSNNTPFYKAQKPANNN